MKGIFIQSITENNLFPCKNLNRRKGNARNCQRLIPIITIPMYSYCLQKFKLLIYLHNRVYNKDDRCSQL